MHDLFQDYKYILANLYYHQILIKNHESHPSTNQLILHTSADTWNGPIKLTIKTRIPFNHYITVLMLYLRLLSRGTLMKRTLYTDLTHLSTSTVIIEVAILCLSQTFKETGVWMQKSSFLMRKMLIDWLLGFNIRAAIFQLYSDDRKMLNKQRRRVMCVHYWRQNTHFCCKDSGDWSHYIDRKFH